MKKIKVNVLSNIAYVSQILAGFYMIKCLDGYDIDIIDCTGDSNALISNMPVI